ncbi:MAG: hypothetical protein GKR96_07565 [Gammaproteobacteria bacterium]|nr:hypothetical protein [Gammaproteobacteria bacterium]
MLFRTLRLFLPQKHCSLFYDPDTISSKGDVRPNILQLEPNIDRGTKIMRKTTYLAAAVVITQAIAATLPAYGAGFQNSSVSTTGIGRANAGSGISGDSISDMFANPAGLNLREGREFEAGLHAISLSAPFENSGSTQTYAGVLTVPAQGANSDGGTSSLVPNFYYSAPLSDNLQYGIGLTTPFGLSTEYDSTWVGRYAAVNSELTTLELNPALAYQVSPFVSVGIGLTLLQVDAELTNAQFIGVGSSDGVSTVKGDDTSIGWTAGLIVGDDQGRFGFSYRSEVQIKPEGELVVSPLGIRAGASGSVTLPKTLYFSGMKVLSDKLDLLGSLRHTDWDSFQELRFKFDNGLPDDVTPSNWKSTNTYSVGMNYRSSDQWTYRGGLGVDESPVSDQYRTARIPDTKHKWLSLGMSYKTAGNIRLDLSYAHVLGKDATIGESSDLVSTVPGAAVDSLSGSYNDSSADIISFSVSIPLGK